jgi:hypothetical protein
MRRSPLIVAAVLAALAALVPAIAAADDDHRPTVSTPTVGEITTTTAAVSANVNPRGSTTSYVVQWGTPAGYTSQTAAVEVADDNAPTRVSVTLHDLTRATTYQVRVVATNSYGTTAGLPATLTTAADDTGAAAPGTDSTGGTQDPEQPAVGDLSDDTPASPSSAALGRTVVVGLQDGAVKVRLPGAAGFVALRAGAAIPVGSVVDARAGTVRLTTAVGTAGATQQALLRGGQFRVRQAAAERGMTELVLRGGGLERCPRVRAGAARTAAVSPSRRLWAHDHGGRFRTRGAHSVATVRGTTWTTVDTCAGTLTRVADGAVRVRELRGRRRTVLVHAGHRVLVPAR